MPRKETNAQPETPAIVWLTVKQAVAYAQQNDPAINADSVRNAIKLRKEFHNYNTVGEALGIDAPTADTAPEGTPENQIAATQNSRYRPDDSVDYKIVEVTQAALDAWLANRTATTGRATPDGTKAYVIRLTDDQVAAFKAGTLQTSTIPISQRSQPKAKAEPGANGVGEAPADTQPDPNAPTDGSDSDLFSNDPLAPGAFDVNADASAPSFDLELNEGADRLEDVPYN